MCSDEYNSDGAKARRYEARSISEALGALAIFRAIGLAISSGCAVAWMLGGPVEFAAIAVGLASFAVFTIPYSISRNIRLCKLRAKC